MAVSITYGPGALGVPALRRALDEVVGGLERDGIPVPQASAAGLSWRDIRQGIVIEPSASGIDAGTVAVVVAFAPSINHILRSAWDEVIMPRLRLDVGRDVLGPQVDGGDADGDSSPR